MMLVVLSEPPALERFAEQVPGLRQVVGDRNTPRLFFFFLNDPAPTESPPFPHPAPLPIGDPAGLCSTGGLTPRRSRKPISATRQFVCGTAGGGASGAGAGAGIAGATGAGRTATGAASGTRSEEHTAELPSPFYIVCRLLL